MKIKHTLTLFIAFTCTSQAALVIGPGVRNGSFESGTGKIADWAGVDDWDDWDASVGGTSVSNDDSGTDLGSEPSHGTRVAFLQPGNAAYNMSTVVLAEGDELSFQWDWTLAGRGNALVSLAYLDDVSGNVINFGPLTTAPDTVTGHLNLGGSYTVQAGDAWIGKTVGLTAQSEGNWPELDNFRLNVTPIPEPSSTALLGLGGLALISRRRK